MTGPEHVDNRTSGDNYGNVVQAGSIGDVIINQSAPRSGAVDRRLLALLRTMTAPLWLGPAARTAFTVAPGRLVSFGTEMLFRDGGGQAGPCLCCAVEPGDELWALGYPRGDEAEATVVGLRCPAVLDRDHAVPQRLDLVFGKPGVGSTGGPVLNWRTGSVCGLLLVTADTGLWLMPLQPEAPADSAWLALMDDAQLMASGQHYPNAVLRTYLTDVRRLGEGHPYRPMVQQGPSLSAFYLPQRLYHESDVAERVSVRALADRHDGAQVVGDPGVGKSSLVRHLASDSAARWLAGETGTFVPIPLSARALAVSGPLPRLLADGVTREVSTVIDTPSLVTLFEREPMPGVPWLVLVDGLDEVLSDFDRRMVLDRVLGHRDSYRFLVTSRPLGRDAFDRLSQQYPTYVVEPFDDKELTRFARAWFTDAGHRDIDGMVREFLVEVARTGLGRLARVPLVSMMLCMVFTDGVGDGLPRSQYAVYERFFAVLARKLETSGVREEFRRQVSVYGHGAEEAVARFITDLPALLEEIAIAQQGLTGEPDLRPILAQAIARFAKPTAIPYDTWAALVAEALRASGLLVHRRSDFRFLHQTIGEYLAAKRLAARADAAERRAMLAPQTEWPWPHLEIKIFVVALWTDRGIDLTQQFMRLLRSRNRDANVSFLVELGRRGIPLPTNVHARVCEFLAERIHSSRAMAQEWSEAMYWLRDLDPPRAADELALVVRRIPGAVRAMSALTELIRLDPARGMTLIFDVLDARAHSPDRLLGLATHALEFDRATGVRALRELAIYPSMGISAVEAATRLARVDRQLGLRLLGWIVSVRRSAEVTFAACQALLRYGKDGVAELDRFGAPKGLAPESLLALADGIAEISPAVAERYYDTLAYAKGHPADIRFMAAQALARLNFEVGVNAVRELALDVEVLLAARIEAARLLAKSDPQRAAGVLADLVVADGGQPEVLDLGAGLPDEDRALVMIRFVANSLAPKEKRRSVAARVVESGRGAQLIMALEDVAAGVATPMPERLLAGELVTDIDRERGLAVFRALAKDIRLPGAARLMAADAMRGIDKTLAIELYVEISTNSREETSRIEAARKAAEIDALEGMWALVDLAHTLPGTYHERIAEAALAVDPSLAADRWSQLPRRARDAMQRVMRRGFTD